MSATTLSPEWESALGSLYFAFQPIARSSDGRVYGYEALLRGYREAGFFGIASIFDSAFLDGALQQLDKRLRAKAVADFAANAPAGAKLFYNVDNRLFRIDDKALEETVALAADYGLPASRIVLELSERHELEGDSNFERAIGLSRELGFRIAIDDFGSGYAGLKLLHMSQPDIVKIDRHFVDGSGAEPRKAAFLEKIVGMAHLMGVTVVAEGVETESELGVCIESGCDMIQGFLIRKRVAYLASSAAARLQKAMRYAIPHTTNFLAERTIPRSSAAGFVHLRGRPRGPGPSRLPIVRRLCKARRRVGGASWERSSTIRACARSRPPK
jgi:EAL domain-containing protein (putative c-di-GMP-specific phosphodiesterase class I)